MDNNFFLLITLSTFVLNYLTRAIPLVFFKGRIKNKFINSFLAYVPYAVMTTITIPAVFTSTSSVISAACGVALTVVLCLLGQGMIVNALSSTLVVFIIEFFILKLF